MARDRELLEIGKEVKRYQLLGLRPGTSYEARVSHPASIPVQLLLRLKDPNQEVLPTRLKSSFRRRILDCDKITFQVAADGSVQEVRDPVLLLEARHGSVHRNGPSGGVATLIYNIVVQELWLGIPTDALPIIAALVVFLGALVLLLPWWVDIVLPQLEGFVLVPDTTGSQLAAQTARVVHQADIPGSSARRKAR